MNTTWNNYFAKIWGGIQPPVRPYDEEVRIFKKYIQNYIEKNNKTPDVLILGSTPELRDVAYMFDIIPTVVDYSQENYDLMSQLTTIDGKDNFINCNWLDLLEQNDVNTYDFILGEAAFNVIRPEATSKLAHICRVLLKSDGHLILKEWIRFSDMKPDLMSLIEEYRNENSTREFYFYLCSALQLYYYDYEKEVVQVRWIDKGLRELYEANIISKNEQMSIGKFNYQHVNLNLYIPRIENFLHEMNDFYNVKELHTVQIAFAETHPIFDFVCKE